MDIGSDFGFTDQPEETDLEGLARSVQASLDPMGQALATALDELSQENIEELAQAFMQWAFPAHLLAHHLNEFYVVQGQEVPGLREMAYALAPFNNNMIQILEGQDAISDMAIQWLAVREGCERVLGELHF